jgi:hypothetical protein
MDIQNKYQATAKFIVNRYKNILSTEPKYFKGSCRPPFSFSLLHQEVKKEYVYLELSLFHLDDMHYPQTAKNAIRSEIYKTLNIPEPVEQ